MNGSGGKDIKEGFNIKTAGEVFVFIGRIDNRLRGNVGY